MSRVLADFLIIIILRGIGKATLVRESHSIAIVLLDELKAVVFIATVSTPLLILELDRILTVLSEELANATCVIAVQFVIIGETQELG